MGPPTAKIAFLPSRLERLEAAHPDIIACFCFAARAPFRGIAGLLDWRLGGAVSRLRIDNFISGAANETVLYPLGERLAGARLLLVGAGPRESLDAQTARHALQHLFATLQKLDASAFHLALPGRPDEVSRPEDAVATFLDALTAFPHFRAVTLVDTVAAQARMQPFAERWRLKHSVSAP